MKARVIQEHKTNYILRDGKTDLRATVRGSFFQDGMFPKVGDYVEYVHASKEKAVIEKILPRSSVVSRKSAHDDSTQVIVTNVDIIFIVMGLDNDFNLSRLERYLLLAQQSGVKAVVILNKSDQLDDEELRIKTDMVKKMAGASPVHALSAKEQQGMEVLLDYFKTNPTVVLLGSSGAGKSTITNWLLSDNTQKIKKVRSNDSRGRHTTTSRQLFELPVGGYLIDTPGMRELNVQETKKEDEEAIFSKFSSITTQCKFSNCDHEKSAGCAVLAALGSGDITQREFDSYRKIKEERDRQQVSRGPAMSKAFKKKKNNLLERYEQDQQGTEQE